MIICDIDDTVLEHLSDKPIQKTIDYVNSLNTRVVMVTGRPRAMRLETEEALRNAGLNYSSLLMNPYSFRETNKWKAECANKLHDATLAIDDNEKSRAIYKAEGIKAIHPNEIVDMEKVWTYFEINSGY